MVEPNKICLRIEEIKIEHDFETYLEAISHYIEYESDHEPEQIAKLLNKKIIGALHDEGINIGLIRGKREAESLF